MRIIKDSFIGGYKYRRMDSFMHMDNEWLIVCSQSLKYYVHCICGHRVKRITYLYHKQSKAIQYVGKTCVRKYGIEMSLTNPILLEVIKANLSKAEWDRDACVREHIQSQYTTFMTMAKEEDTIAYSVVGPFRRLLSDVCDLVSEFNYDLVDVLRDIEREVESLNQTTRHQMVDEYSLCDSISEIASEHSDTELSERNMEDAEAEEPGVIGVILEEMVTDIVVETGLKEIISEDVPAVAEETGLIPVVAEETGLIPAVAVETGLIPVVAVETGLIPVVAVETGIKVIMSEDVPAVAEETGLKEIMSEHVTAVVVETGIKEIISEDVSAVAEETGLKGFMEDVPAVVVETGLKEIISEDVSAVAEETGLKEIMSEGVSAVVVETGLKEIISEGVPALINQPESMIDKFVRTTTIDDQDTCSATAHCYCGMKYRLRRLQEGINELRQTIEDNRKEAQELIEQSREQREKAKEYLERSRKQHPKLFSEDEDKDEDKDEKKN
jgi:hypothetical protein